MPIYIKKKDILLIFAFAAAGSLIASLLLCLWGTAPEKFYDIIMGISAQNNVNKIAEETAFWVVCITGIILLGILFRHNKSQTVAFIEEQTIDKTIINLYLVILFSSFISKVVIDGKAYYFLLLTAIILILLKRYTVYKALEYLDLYLLIFANSFCILVVASLLGIKLETPTYFCIGGAIFWFIMLYFSCDTIGIKKLILLLQIPVPLIFLVFLRNRYLYQKKYITLPLPFQFYAFISIFMITLIAISVYNCIKKWKCVDKYEAPSLLSITSCISVFVFFTIYQSIWGGITELYVTSLKPRSEEILGFQQLVLGTSFYEQYFPVSGLFSLPIGAIGELLGGTYELNYLTSRVLQIIVFTIFIILSRRFLSVQHIFFLSFILISPIYNRGFFVLLGFFLLYQNKDILNKNAWLKLWIWTCFLSGLYYPMYAIGLFLGTMPIAVVQAIQYCRSDSFRLELKKHSFYINWTITLFPIACCLPLLYRMAKHILIYSKYATQATTGTAPLYGKIPYGNFLQWINSESIRQLAYYCLVFLIPLFLVWIWFLLVVKSICEQKKWYYSYAFHTYFSGFVITLFAVSGSLRRMTGTGSFPSIHGRFFIPTILILLIILIKDVHRNRYGLTLIGMVAGIASLCGFVRGDNLKWQLQNFYKVPSSYEALIPNEFNRTGKYGFIDSDYQKELRVLKQRVAQLREADTDLSFLGLSYSSSTNCYILDIPACGQISVDEIKTYPAWKQLKEVILRERPVIGTYIYPTSYYLYHWLMTTQDYKYSAEYEMFLPEDLYKKLGLPDKSSLKQVSFLSSGTYQIASSLGKSMESLTVKLEKCDASMNVSTSRLNQKTIIKCKLERPINGADFDFLYLNLSDKENKKSSKSLRQFLGLDKQPDQDVTVEWKDDATGEAYSYSCAYGNGQLLIPLGLEKNWLLGEHDSISISIESKNLTINELYFCGIKER